jgi:hypothetical protein
MFELLAIVQVDPERRIRCGAPGCKKTVYAKIHVVREDGALKVLGSTCFNRLYSESNRPTPRFTSGVGRLLTEEERLRLIENTEELIRDLEEQMPAQIAVPNPEPESIETKSDRPVGPSRNVVCKYCRMRMTTTLLRRPARGFRCKEC